MEMENALPYEEPLRQYMLAHVKDVCKSPRAFIRYPFIDPGSAYEGNVWDWDTFWSAYGFLNLMGDMDTAGQKDLLCHARGNVLNFFDHQQPDGYIPMMIEVGRWEAPYLNIKHREGVQMNMHKPFLCSQIRLVSEASGDYGWAKPYLDNLERYFKYYDEHYFFTSCGLYVWADDIMIGVDNDPASFGRPRYSTANIFLNAFMTVELGSMEILCRKWGDGKKAEAYAAKREALAGCIQAECWDPRDKFFYSVDVDVHTRPFDWFHQGMGVFWKTLPIKVQVWSGFIPLYARLASSSQAASLLAYAQNPRAFACPYGVTTLAQDEKMFNLEASINPSNWLGPIWMVANYVVFRGLCNYGYWDAARVLCEQSLELLGRDLADSETLHEYYNPYTGKPIMNGGFINWNVLALNMADELRGKKPMCGVTNLEATDEFTS
jgi:putative isomerase